MEDLPIYVLKAGDEIEVKNAPASRQFATRNLEENRIRNVPGWLALNAELFLPAGAVGHGAIYTDSQYVNQANTQELDAWTRVDAGARYATKIEGRPTTFRATVQNVFDREYWSGVASYGAFSPGYPRTLQLSATVDF